ncbi:hypothetical protein WJX74_004327 [Apatococcus lobatus]|uniref:ribose-5-phosphate isomerase n=2 Tax=Apatococcus TaxID=904362 RepID=A0AAW1T2S9_9CHLO
MLKHTVLEQTLLHTPSLRSQPHRHRRIKRRRLGSSCVRAQSSVVEEQLCRFAARRAVDEFVTSGQVLGLGHGTLVNYAIEYIAELLQLGELQRVNCIPGSDLTASEAAFQGVPLTALALVDQVDVMLTEADELDTSEHPMSFVTGRIQAPQQPQLLKTRMLIDHSEKVVAILAREQKARGRLGNALPIVIEGGENWEEAAEELDSMFLGDAEVWRRPSSSSGISNPRGEPFPYTSPEGHAILDVRFYGSFKLDGKQVPYEELLTAIEGVPGVVTHGLFHKAASAAVLAAPDGPVLLPTG